jgi:protein-tyrosine phosphatase
MTKVLMVCLGNICRSPLAEGILSSKLPSSQFQVDSAGTADYHLGGPPDLRTIAVAKENGIDISNQRARQFTASDFDTFDYIYAMDGSNFSNILKLARHEQDLSKVKLIMNAAGNADRTDVPDPYFGSEDGFKHVFRILEKACQVLARKLIDKAHD